MNRRLAYMPRFRAPGVLRKFMIQSMIHAQTVFAPVRVPGVTVRTQRIIHMGCAVDLRILKGASSRGVYIDIHGGGWSIGSAAMDDAVNARIALHVRVIYGRDPHHITEAQYKAVARALRQAVESDPRVAGVPSTKGVL
jgi:acetyl esterase/lipase